MLTDPKKRSPKLWQPLKHPELHIKGQYCTGVSRRSET
jgi:hypothetical protein